MAVLKGDEELWKGDVGTLEANFLKKKEITVLLTTKQVP